MIGHRKPHRISPKVATIAALACMVFIFALTYGPGVVEYLRGWR